MIVFFAAGSKLCRTKNAEDVKNVSLRRINHILIRQLTEEFEEVPLHFYPRKSS